MKVDFRCSTGDRNEKETIATKLRGPLEVCDDGIRNYYYTRVEDEAVDRLRFIPFSCRNRNAPTGLGWGEGA